MSALATWRPGSSQVRARSRCFTRSPSPSRRSTSPNGATSNASHAPHLAAARVGTPGWLRAVRSEEHTSELQSRFDLVCRLLLEKKNITNRRIFLALHWLLMFYRKTIQNAQPNTDIA